MQKSLIALVLITGAMFLAGGPASAQDVIDNAPNPPCPSGALPPINPGTMGSRAEWSDDFNRADGTDMGPDWTETEGDHGIQSNQGVGLYAGHSKMQHNSASMSYADSVSSVEFYNTTGSIVYTGLIAGWGTDGVFLKIQDNDSDGYYDKVFFYNAATGSGWTGATSYDLAVPTLSGVGTLYFTNGGDTANFDVDRDFDGIVDEHFECDGVTTMTGLGSAFGIATYQAATFDNWDVATPVASLPYYDGFESGRFGPEWETAVTSQGRIQITTANSPYAGSYHVTMDDTTGDTTYSTVTMTLSIDLSSVAQCDLEFMFKEWSDEPDYEDGVFISDDDVTYYKALDLSGTSTYTLQTVDIDAAAAAAGMSLTSDFKIRFSWRDNFPITSDGFAFDDINVKAPVAAFPFYEGFETGSLGEVWATAVSGAGQILVTTLNDPIDTYHLTMDSTTNGTDSFATLTLSIDLSSTGQCELDFMWKEFGDEDDPEDGVFISEDGITYHKVLDLWGGTTTYEQKIVDIDQAAASAGISLTSNFRIRFSWNDNYLIPTDGFAFDDINVKLPLMTGSLTTLFSGSNGSQGNTFDIVPYWTIDEITGIDINTSSTSAVSVDVYYKTGTCVGYETDPGAWSLLVSGTGTGQGLDNPTYIDLPGAAGVSFYAGQTYGMYVDVVTGGIRYTDGGPNTYENSYLKLITNSGQGSTFGSTFYPRQWNGTVYYTLDPLLVELIFFKACGRANKVLVVWKTASEIETAGFHIWRSDKPYPEPGDFVKITDQLIPAKGSATHGALYSHFDRGVASGYPYKYKLEEITTGGKSSFHKAVPTRWFH